MPQEGEPTDLRPLYSLSGKELAVKFMRLLAGDVDPYQIDEIDPYAPSRYIWEVISTAPQQWSRMAVQVLDRLYRERIDEQLARLRNLAVAVEENEQSTSLWRQLRDIAYLLRRYYDLRARTPSSRIVNETFTALLTMEEFLHNEIRKDSVVAALLDTLLDDMRVTVASGHSEALIPLKATIAHYYESPRRARIALSFFIKHRTPDLERSLGRALQTFAREGEEIKNEALDTISRAIGTLRSQLTEDALLQHLVGLATAVDEPLYQAEAAGLIARALARCHDLPTRHTLVHSFLREFFHRKFTWRSQDFARIPDVLARLAGGAPVRSLLKPLKQPLRIPLTEYTETAALVLYGEYLQSSIDGLRVEYPHYRWIAPDEALQSYPNSILFTNDIVRTRLTTTQSIFVPGSEPVFTFSAYVLFVSRDWVLKRIDAIQDPTIATVLDSLLEQQFRFGPEEDRAPEVQRTFRHLITGARCGALHNTDLEFAAHELMSTFSGIKPNELGNLVSFPKQPTSDFHLNEFIDGRVNLFCGGANHTYYLQRYHNHWAIPLNDVSCFSEIRGRPAVDYLVYKARTWIARSMTDLYEMWFAASYLLKTLLQRNNPSQEERQLLAYLLRCVNQNTEGFCDVFGMRTILTEWDEFFSGPEEARQRAAAEDPAFTHGKSLHERSARDPESQRELKE